MGNKLHTAKGMSIGLLGTIILIVLLLIIFSKSIINVVEGFTSNLCEIKQKEEIDDMLLKAGDVERTGEAEEYELEVNGCIECVAAMENNAVTSCNAVVASSVFGGGWGKVLGTLSCISDPLKCIWNIGNRVGACQTCCCQAGVFNWGSQCLSTILSPNAIFCTVTGTLRPMLTCKYESITSTECFNCWEVRAQSSVVKDRRKFVGFGWDENSCYIRGGNTYTIKISKKFWRCDSNVDCSSLSPVDCESQSGCQIDYLPIPSISQCVDTCYTYNDEDSCESEGCSWSEGTTIDPRNPSNYFIEIRNTEKEP